MAKPGRCAAAVGEASAHLNVIVVIVAKQLVTVPIAKTVEVTLVSAAAVVFIIIAVIVGDERCDSQRRSAAALPVPIARWRRRQPKRAVMLGSGHEGAAKAIHRVE
jgi:hypothetical protein